MKKLDYLDLALRVATNLEKSAIRHWGYVTWLKKQRPLNYHLYDGISGIALFFASLYDETNEQKYRQLALKAIKPLRKTAYSRYHVGNHLKEPPLGIAVGISSYLYALIRIGYFLREDFSKELEYYASFLTKEAIEKDEQLDVMHGASGTILALIKLYEFIGSNTALERAYVAGEHIVKTYFIRSTDNSKRTLTGFSHGAAGISYALLALYKKTKTESFRKKAEQLLAYERSVYSNEAKNWPDFRGDTISYVNSWCHGATGIGLARIGCLASYDDKKIKEEIERVFTLNVTEPFSDIIHLCCGNFGRLEFLLTYAVNINNKKMDYAHNYAKGIVHTTNVTTELDRLLEIHALLPGFFLGLAGIGYQFLRMHQPTHYPSILLFE